MLCQSLRNVQLGRTLPFSLHPNFYYCAWCLVVHNIPLAKSDELSRLCPLPTSCLSQPYLLMKIFTHVNLILWSCYYIYFSLFPKLNTIYLKYTGFLSFKYESGNVAICSERVDWTLLALGYLCNLICCLGQLYKFFYSQKTHFDLLYLSTILFIAFWVMDSEGIFLFSASFLRPQQKYPICCLRLLFLWLFKEKCSCSF